MAQRNVIKALIGAEDIEFGTGTFSRVDSTGVVRSISRVNIREMGLRIYNVQDYMGGAPDGSADNTTDIQAAIDACEATGGVVYFPGALQPYRAVGLTVNEPIMVCGDGRTSQIKTNGAGTLFAVDEGTNQNIEGQNPGVVFRDLYLNGNARVDAATALSLAHLDHSLFQNLWIEEFKGSSDSTVTGAAIAFMDSVRESHFVDIRMRYCGQESMKWVVGITDSGPTTQDKSNNNLFQRCAFVYFYGDAVVISNPADGTNRIRGQKFIDCLWHGVLDTVPIHPPTSGNKQSYAISITESEANVVENCRFSTGPEDNPYIYVNDTNLNGPTSGALTLDVRGCLFTQHLTSTADNIWGIKIDAGTVALRQNIFVAQDPAWEVATGASLYRDDSNILIAAPATGKIIEADDAGPDVFVGDGLLQDLGGSFTVQTKDASGTLTRRLSFAGGTDTADGKFLGIPIQVGTAAPTHNTDAGGAALPSVALYVRATGGLDADQVVYLTVDGGTTWVQISTPRYTTTARDALSPAAGLTIYNTTTNKLNFYNGSSWEVVTSA